jgi:hypothetical protein
LTTFAIRVSEGALKLVDGDSSSTLALLVTLLNASAQAGSGSEVCVWVMMV